LLLFTLDFNFLLELYTINDFSGDGSVKYNCTVCEKMFKSKKNCFYHLTCNGDGIKKTLTCQKCNKSFKIQSHLDYHMLTHSGKTYC